jgi:mycothiol S-conjugate amidase
VWSRAQLVARHEALLQLGLPSPFDPERWQRRPSMDYRITTRIYTGDHWEHMQAALCAHATQIDPDSPYWFGLPPDIARTVYPYEDYILAHSTVPTTLPEDDLFTGVVGDAVRYLPDRCPGM